MRALKFTWTSLQLVGGTVAALAVLWLVTQWLLGFHLLNVQTGSMRPVFKPHDALVMQHINPARVRPGMVVSYKSSRNPNELITHRIIKISKESFQTKGDAASAADSAIRKNLLVGRVVAVLPGLGRPLDWLRSWTGLAVCVYIPVAAIAASELHKLERHYRTRQKYQVA